MIVSLDDAVRSAPSQAAAPRALTASSFAGRTGFSRSRFGLDAAMTTTKHPNSSRNGMRATRGSTPFIARASQGGQNIGTNPAKRTEDTRPPLSSIQRRIRPIVEDCS